ncbi:MAG: hypothetical protein R3236_05165, partial [Phycisphaeraceae bacterium]|nr:hypothetical protein [Phycisphaeraceae bacterium]
IGCASLGKKLDGWEGLRGHETIAVLPFKDHISDDPDDSKDTGAICQRFMAQALLEDAGIRAKVYDPASRDSRKLLRSDQAISMGRKLGVQYVIYGDCTEFYRVAPFTFRVDRAGMRVWMVRVQDGKLVFTASDTRRTDDNLEQPEDAIEQIAEEMVEGMKK